MKSIFWTFATNVSYGGQSYSNFVNFVKMGQSVLLGRNWHEKIVLDWKTVFSDVRPNAYKSQSEILKSKI